jgi:hypothetical protein
MAHDEMLWKTTHRKIKGQTKPFIDANLQIQIPGLDASSESFQDDSHPSVYAHFCQDPFVITQEMAAMESELNTAIEEAQQTYAAWKKMQLQLLNSTEQIKK